MRLAAGTPDPARQEFLPVTAGIGIILARQSVDRHENLRLGGRIDRRLGRCGPSMAVSDRKSLDAGVEPGPPATRPSRE